MKKKKCVLLHDFLFVLNQYVYELIVVPVAKKDGGHNLINNKNEQVKKRKMDPNPSSFWEKHKQPLKIVQYVGLAILMSGLLYRLVKKEKNGVFALF